MQTPKSIGEIILQGDENRANVFLPILTHIVGLVVSVYLFEQLEEEKTDQSLATWLFASAIGLMTLIAVREMIKVNDWSAKAAHAFLVVASYMVFIHVSPVTPAPA